MMKTQDIELLAGISLSDGGNQPAASYGTAETSVPHHDEDTYHTQSATCQQTLPAHRRYSGRI